MKFKLIEKYSIVGTSYFEIRRAKDNILYTCCTSPWEWARENLNCKFEVSK